MYKPTESDPEDTPKSLMILHLAGNTHELVELLEKKKTFMIKSGHMSIEDQTLIIEILFEHAFKHSKIQHKNLVVLLKLLKEFLDLNYDKLNLVLDWKPCFNSLYAILDDNELKMELFAMSTKKENIFSLIEKVFMKLNKFFKQGSGTEILEAVKPYLFPGHPRFLANTLCFSVLVPTKRFNTDEDEVQEWLPIIIDLWKSMPSSTYFRSIFMRLLAQVTQNFNRLDFSEYDEWVVYQLNLTITSGGQGGGHGQAPCEKF